jgi:hypothetical protein
MREPNVGGETPESENISRKHRWPYHREGDGREIPTQAIIDRLGNLVGRLPILFHRKLICAGS